MPDLYPADTLSRLCQNHLMKTLITVVLPVLLVFAVASLFLYSRSITDDIERQYPPAGQFISVDGTQLHYLDSDHDSTQRAIKKNDNNGQSSPVLVLLHGASTSALDFRHNLFESLSQNARVLAFDRPGHGYSERPLKWTNPAMQAQLIAKALEQLGVQESVWIGHSWAGSVVMAGMLNHPSLVVAGVSIAGASHPWIGKPVWHVRLASLPVLGSLFSHVAVPIAGRASIPAAVQGVFSPDAVPQDYIEQTGVLLSVRPKAFMSNAADRNYLSAWLEGQVDRYPSLSQPLLLITASEDTIVPSWNHAERLVKILDNANWQVLDNAGHAPHHSRRTEVQALIDDFIARL